MNKNSQNIKSVQDADVAGKRVLVRVMLNVPLADGRVADDLRLKAVVPTLEFLHHKGAQKIVLMGYVGRPGGKVAEGLRVAPVAARLRELTSVPFDVLENLRFDPREESNDPEFAKELAAHGDIYVNDAFADAHRAYASVVGVPKLLPSYAGLLFGAEVGKLSQALQPPPGALAVLGGAKFETKEPLLQKLLASYSTVLLGGALGNDVIKARGFPVGSSLVSDTPVPVAIAANEKLVVATDAVVKEKDINAERTALVIDMRATEAVVDIGPVTAASWAKRVAEAPFVLWNGPMGVYEDGYTDGTDVLAGALARGTGTAVVGGGDTIAALHKYTFDKERVFVSTGGGAMLQFLTDGTLPAIEALRQ